MPISNVAKRKPAHPDEAELFVALGRRIKQMRKERGWSLSNMHLIHGYVPSQWRRFEKGKIVSIGSMLKIADIFDQDIGTLVRSLGAFPRTKKEDF